MEKPVRYAVRSFLIQGNKIIVTRYKGGVNDGFYDTPGGKIEDGETPEEASVREFKEETGINVLAQKHIGHAVVEFPNRIYDFELFLITDYQGQPGSFLENDALWIDIDTLLQAEKKFSNIEIIKYLDEEDIDLYIAADMDNSITRLVRKKKEK